MVAYIGYLKHNPEQHKESNYRMPGGKYTAYGILVFFAFIFVILLINSSTRLAVLFIPVWVLVLFLMYQKYKKNLVKLKFQQKMMQKLQKNNG